MKKYILGTLFFLAPFFIISQEIISLTNHEESITLNMGLSLLYEFFEIF